VEIELEDGLQQSAIEHFSQRSARNIAEVQSTFSCESAVDGKYQLTTVRNILTENITLKKKASSLRAEAGNIAWFAGRTKLTARIAEHERLNVWLTIESTRMPIERNGMPFLNCFIIEDCL